MLRNLTILTLTLILSSSYLQAKSLMFKDQEIEHQKRVKKYKNYICLEGICILDNNRWVAYINNSSYSQKKNKVKDRFIIDKVTKNRMTIIDLDTQVKHDIMIGENLRINKTIKSNK